MQSLVTQWGLDPLWDTALPKTKTSVADFLARVLAESVQLLERPGGTDVSVVGHRVHWDEVRHPWYRDIELNPGTSYMPFVRLALVRYQPHALYDAKVSKVVLAEFAQVLPRRHAVLKRDGQSVTLSLRSTAPHSGPMKFPIDSEYADVSIIPGPHESGRNRGELVLQTRDPGFDSDLAWRDSKTIGSAIVGASGNGGTVFTPCINPGGIFARRAASATGSRTLELRAGGAVKLASTVDLSHADPVADATVTIPRVIDPEIWSVAAMLPDARGKPSRLMLREFER